MIQCLKVTILVDNKPGADSLLSEHGLSLWLEADGFRILFDTGQSDMPVGNARLLGIDISAADAVVISHGHYDHTGGIARILAGNRSATVFCHPGIFIPRYSRQSDGSMKSVGIQGEASSALHQILDEIHWVHEPVSISDDIGITGPIPRITGFEDTGGAFYLDIGAKRTDPIDDDLALWFRTGEGIVVVTGCCHSGIVNTLEYVKTITGQADVLAVLGGLHLLHASTERLEKTREYLKRSIRGTIHPCHCTGDKAIDFLRTELGYDRLIEGNTGARFRFGPA